MDSSKNKMLIDSTHPEETRVVVLRNGRVEEFDWESAARKLLRGNIYLAKVTRVEPSLQAAFVDYGGNRHGFLAFSEIHPDYYQIPVADRQALLREEAEAEEAKARAEAAADAALPETGPETGSDFERSASEAGADDDAEPESGHQVNDLPDQDGERAAHQPHDQSAAANVNRSDEVRSEDRRPPADDEPERHAAAFDQGNHDGQARRIEQRDGEAPHANGFPDAQDTRSYAEDSGVIQIDGPDANGTSEIETVGAEDAVEEIPDRPRRPSRIYKIQEVIKRRQIILVQVVKEERGNKGAALTTYLSLAGRYTVLMPNTARGGGISRKITNPADRKRLRKIVTDLEVPQGMGLIVRTAGASRTKAEIKRDFEYLLRVWESVRDLTLRSTAPALVYEEGDLIKRSIRDLYTKEIDEIVVAGEHAYRDAHDFMQMLMPSHARNVVAYAEPEPLFTKYQIERQLNAMFSPVVTLRSGGYIVINQTEALVAIDVNSGKATREHNIEDTAFKTNMEASEEIARQLKLRDLAGLIVIDYIDMEEKRNNRSVERRIKESLRHDRARIQVGRISHFGLLEMSRQRLRPGVLEGSTSQCPHCQGTGTIRSTESIALAVLRAIEDRLVAGPPHNLVALTTAEVALYILNQKRQFLNDMESRHGVTIAVTGSDKVHGANFVIERGPDVPERAPARVRTDVIQMDWRHRAPDDAGDAETSAPDEDAADEPDDADDAEGESSSLELESGADGEQRRPRRRRRRRDRNEQPAAASGQPGGGPDSDADQHGVSLPRGESSDSDLRPATAGRGERTRNGAQPTAATVDHQPADVDDADDEIETIGGEDQDESTPDRSAGDREAGGEQREGKRGRRRGRRGGRRGRDRVRAEGDAPEAGEQEQPGQSPPPHAQVQALAHEAEPSRSSYVRSSYQGAGNAAPEAPIARPDDWLLDQPTVGDLAAAERRSRNPATSQPETVAAAAPRQPALDTGRADADAGHRHQHGHGEATPGEAAPAAGRRDDQPHHMDRAEQPASAARGPVKERSARELVSTEMAAGIEPERQPEHVVSHEVVPPAPAREPAMAQYELSMASAQSTAAAPAATEHNRPRRSGWWQRKFSGDAS